VKRIVTISAGYGAGGSVVAPAVAQALDMPFLDRAVAVADESDAGPEVAREGERTGGIWSRVLGALAQMPTDGGPSAPPTALSDDELLRREAESQLRRFVEPGQGVILGWAGSLVLPEAFHVRLHGPPDARVRQGMRIDGTIDEVEARRRLEETDRIRSLYWKRLYKRDFADLSPYHLVVDSTALDLDAVRDLVTAGARAFWGR
jgi:hypothetical protein